MFHILGAGTHVNRQLVLCAPLLQAHDAVKVGLKVLQQDAYFTVSVTDTFIAGSCTVSAGPLPVNLRSSTWKHGAMGAAQGSKGKSLVARLVWLAAMGLRQQTCKTCMAWAFADIFGSWGSPS